MPTCQTRNSSIRFRSSTNFYDSTETKTRKPDQNEFSSEKWKFYVLINCGLAMMFSTRFKFFKRNSRTLRLGDGSTIKLKIAAGNEINMSPRTRIFHLNENLYRFYFGCFRSACFYFVRSSPDIITWIVSWKATAIGIWSVGPIVIGEERWSKEFIKPFVKLWLIELMKGVVRPCPIVGPMLLSVGCWNKIIFSFFHENLSDIQQHNKSR